MFRNSIWKTAALTSFFALGATLSAQAQTSGVIANPQSVSLSEDTPKAITLSASSSSSVIYSIETPPKSGVLSGQAPNLTYTPNPNFYGNDFFVFRASNSASSTARVDLSVVGTADIPVARNALYHVRQSTPIRFTMNAFDGDDNGLTFTVVSAPQNGNLDTAGSLKNFRDAWYVPRQGFVGTDTLTFRVNDGYYTSNTATITFQVAEPVSQAPVATADSYKVRAGGTINIAAPGVLSNDSDPDNTPNPLRTILMRPPTYAGQFALSENGAFSYTAGTFSWYPVAPFTDSFTYCVHDGNQTSAPVTVSLNIVPNTAPTANLYQYPSGDEDTSQNIRLFASDAENDALSYEILEGPQNGTFSGTAPNLVYTPKANWNGYDQFRWRAFDGQLASQIAFGYLRVIPVADPAVAVSQRHVVLQNTPKTFALKAENPDGVALNYTITTPPANGVLSGDAPNLTYTPNADFLGEDALEFSIDGGTTTARVDFAVVASNVAPTADAQTVFTSENSAKNITLSGTDPEAMPLSYTLVAAPTRGTLSGTAPNLVYTPNANVFGSDSFSFRVNDGELNSETATVTIIIAEVNDPPTANNSNTTAVIGRSKQIILAASDSDTPQLSFAIVTPPSNGTLGQISNTPWSAASIFYTPATGLYGNDSFTWSVSDGTTTVTATANIKVVRVVANAQTVSTNEDTPISIRVTHSWPDGEPTPGTNDVFVSYGITRQPANGTLNRGPNVGQFTYTPNANWNGTDSFEFGISTLASAFIPVSRATVTINVAPVNDAPVAQSQSVTLAEDSTANILLAASDVENSALTYTLLTSPQNGTLRQTPGTLPGTQYIYTPNPNWNGSDSFTWRANDGALDSNIATVTINVTPTSDRPVAAADDFDTAEDTPLVIAAPGVLFNDSDIDGDALSAILKSQPANGAVTLNRNGGFTYTPDAHFNGIDTFTYAASDGTLESNTVTVKIIVSGVNDAPTLEAIEATTEEDTPLTIGINASDADENLLTFSVSDVSSGTVELAGQYVSVTPAPNSTDTITFNLSASDGEASVSVACIVLVEPVNDAPIAQNDTLADAVEDEILFIDHAILLANDSDVDGDSLSVELVEGPQNGTLEEGDGFFDYTPNHQYSGPDSLSYRAFDGTESSEIVTVSWNVVAVDDAPIADAQSLELDEDTAQNITLSAFDEEGATLAFEIVEGPQNGTLSGTAPALVYTPNANYNGGDAFSFRVFDGQNWSENATVFLVVKPVNDAPLAQTETLTLDEDSTLDFTLRASDADGDTLVFELVERPQNGVLSGAAPNLTFAPSADFNGTQTLKFRVSDGTAQSQIAVVTLEVKPVNDAPIAQNQSVQVAHNTAKTIALGATDADGQTLSFAVVSGPTNGTLSGSGANRVYTPRSGFSGADSFTFRANDGALDSNTATVSISVAGVLPTAHAKSASVLEDAVVTIGLSGTAYNGASVDAWEVVTQPQNGTVEGGGNARNYRPSANFFGTDSFTYRVRDTRGQWSAPATVSLSVNPVNDAPAFTLSSTTVSIAPAQRGTAVTIPNFATNLSKGPANENGQTLTFSVTNYTNGFFAQNPTVDANGTLRFTVKTGKTGSANLQIILRDNGGTNNNGQNQAQPQHFSIRVG